ncbi:DUF4870 domain-containing protein [Patescibacteria group bacterium]|nr:DUF4870 domain-containing protein [Patescibacteria group bacterium]MCG2702686.1 hypothetical protein [Candidatus Parcubacteria bacterium]MBU4265301.1 DUF4870 domain-containing protein [Patescibacteria group bacterium]MBU4389986.1 DUF4870 domain-containing protein [Patescibacteria group bacterium]MBU4397342.1 DUF4870 domain-containing protein [Patescibacteria group bacterium]
MTNKIKTSSTSSEKTNSFNLPDNTVSTLAYSLTLVSGLVVFLMETKNKKIRFHALQSIAFGIFWILIPKFLAITIIMAPLALILHLVCFALWIILMIKTYKKETFRLPIIADWVDKQLK